MAGRMAAWALASGCAQKVPSWPGPWTGGEPSGAQAGSAGAPFRPGALWSEPVREHLPDAWSSGISAFCLPALCSLQTLGGDRGVFGKILESKAKLLPLGPTRPLPWEPPPGLPRPAACRRVLSLSLSPEGTLAALLLGADGQARGRPQLPGRAQSAR